jgi:hypothetical protein
MPEEIVEAPAQLTAQFQRQSIDGAAMRRLRVQRDAHLEALKSSGQLQPATILNFNPITLTVESGLIQYSVPPVTIAPGLAKRIELKLGEKKYSPTALVVRDPRLYFPLRSVQKNGDEIERDYDVKSALPLEQAYQFYKTYNDEGGNNVGGVVVFQGDTNIFKKVPETIKVPKWKMLPNNTDMYFTVEEDFTEVLRRALDKQRAYCDLQLQNAQTYYDDPDQRKNVTNVHRTWAQYALDMGWKEKKPDWLMTTRDNEATCTACGTFKKKADAHFCVCGVPYDPFRSYMDGFLDIANVHLNRITPEQWKAVRKEEEKRKQLRG